MRKIITDALTGLLLLIGTCCFAQPLKMDRIAIGEKIPAIALDYILNQTGKKINLSNPGKKLIILDFWNIWCSACIASLPKMDSLQKKFKDQVQILLITNNNATEVEKTFKKPFLKKVSLPVIAGDTLLSKLFSYQSVPHHVWLNDEGIVEYITYGYNTNENSITNYLSGRKPTLAYKNEEADLDFEKPLWAKKNESFSPHLKYYSYSCGWISEYGGGGKSRFVDSTRDVMGLRFINGPLLSLYQMAFGGFDGGVFRYSNRIVLDVPEPSLFYSPPDDHEIDNWNAKNLVGYEISIPLFKKDELFKFMQEDVNRYFNYSVHVEKKMITSLCLIRTSSQDKLKSFRSTRKVVQTDRSLVIENETIENALIGRFRLSNSSLKTPILDETGYTGNVTMQLNCCLSDIDSLRRELQKYDLDLVAGEREIEMLVIKQKNARCENSGY